MEAITTTDTLTTTWNLDAVHSNINFNIRHMVVSKVAGHFDEFSGSAEFHDGSLEGGKVSFVANTASINTRKADRDAHLKNADFFDVEKYPNISFLSTHIEKTGEETYKVTGDFTMKGVTRSETFEVESGGIIVDPYGMERAGFNLHGKITRSEYGLSYGAVLEAGGAMLADTVFINCDLELVKEKAK